MFAVPEKLKAFTHPHIASMHMKKDFGVHNNKTEDVLVIDTLLSEDIDQEHFNDSLLDILLDLDALKIKAESTFGKIDRIDIRTHRTH
ncbi:MAG: hypothetical protein ACT4OY_08675 [Alphaproteobacteria bacterium]